MTIPVQESLSNFIYLIKWQPKPFNIKSVQTGYETEDGEFVLEDCDHLMSEIITQHDDIPNPDGQDTTITRKIETCLRCPAWRDDGQEDWEC